MFTISTGAGFLPSTAVSFDMILWLEEIPPQDWIPHDARWSKEYFEKVAGAAAKKAQRDGEGRRDDGGIIDRKLPDANSVSHFFLQGFFGWHSFNWVEASGFTSLGSVHSRHIPSKTPFHLGFPQQIY